MELLLDVTFSVLAQGCTALITDEKTTQIVPI